MHTACEVGFWGHPEVQKLARALGKRKDTLAAAGMHILRLRETVLTLGTARGALPKTYRALDIAISVGWEGNPNTIVKHLASAGVLKRGRGGVFVYPNWENSPTGRYASDREWDRTRKRDLRKAKKAADLAAIAAGRPPDGEINEDLSADVHRTGGGRPEDVSVDGGVSKKGSHPGTESPPAPPGGGEDRYAWFSERYIRLQKPAVCRQILNGLSADEWAEFKDCVGRWASSTSEKKKRRGEWSDRFLGNRQWLAWRRVEDAPPPPPPPEVVEARKREIEAERIRMDESARELARLAEIRKRLRAEGVPAGEVHARAFEELEREKATNGVRTGGDA